MTDNDKAPWEGWAILELMGHRRLGGYVRLVELAWVGFFRIDVPEKEPDTVHATQFYSPGSIYCLTPCTEAAARAVAEHNLPHPVQQWELPALPSPAASPASDGPDDFEEEEDDEDF